jgi:hypothetical protein
MRDIIPSWCQIQRTSSNFRYGNSGPAHIQCIYSSAYLVLNIRLNVSAAAVWDMPIFACKLYCKFCAKYRAHTQDCAMWTVVPDIYNAFTAPHIQTSMFMWTDLSWYWRYLDNSIVVILQSWCQIQCTSSGLRYANCGPGHIQSIFSTAYFGFNIQL